MSLTDILIPQLGEGLQEVVLLTVNKKPGDYVKRDELLYSMETDKAVMEVESPFEGVLTEWLAAEGAVLPIGATVARIETESAAADVAVVPSTTNGHQPQATVERAEVQIPPRTRAHAKEHGVSDDELRLIPAPSGKLMPADIDAYLATRTSGMKPEAKWPAAVEETSAGYVDRPLSQQQRLFVHRLKRSAQTVVPATMKQVVDWAPISRAVADMRARVVDVRPSEFQTFAYCVAQTVGSYPKFRSNLVSDEAAREYAHVNLGIAVARPNDDLVTAVVPSADALGYVDFIKTAKERIKSAREGEDQAGADTHLLLTYMGSFGVVDAIPVLVSPAIAVLFIGSTYEQGGRTVANLVMTFDHRLINGVEAARFLQAVVAKVEGVGELGN